MYRLSQTNKGTVGCGKHILYTTTCLSLAGLHSSSFTDLCSSDMNPYMAHYLEREIHRLVQETVNCSSFVAGSCSIGNTLITDHIDMASIKSHCWLQLLSVSNAVD